MADSSFPDLASSEPDELERNPVHKAWRSRPRVLISLETPEPGTPIVHEETSWRSPDIPRARKWQDAKLVVSRWQGRNLHEHSSEITGDYHVVGIATRPTQFALWLGAQLFPIRNIVPGMIQITGPAVPARIVYARPYAALHLYVPQALLVECFEWRHGRRPPSEIVLRDPMFEQDALLQKISTILLSIADADDPYGVLHADFLNLAIIARLLGQYGEAGAQLSRQVSALPRWRLRRAIDFIDANLDSPVTLGELSQAVGLSRMHFAAQFRAATGTRPHEYVLRRRIEKAQEMLVSTHEPIAELALAVGFSSQAHFTTVFKRFSGVTPASWRRRAILA